MSNTFEVFKQSDPESAAAEAGGNLNSLLIDMRKQPVLLLLSAGSALSILNYVGQSALGANLTVSMLDERFSTDHKINNVGQLQHLDFYSQALDADCSFFG